MDKNALSQEDIDALFQKQAAASSAQKQARAYDFRRSDRIPKEQIRALRAVHDTFATKPRIQPVRLPADVRHRQPDFC